MNSQKNTLIIPPLWSVKFNVRAVHCSAYIQKGISVLAPHRSDQLNSISISLLQTTDNDTAHDWLETTTKVKVKWKKV
jgi:hypothetical protein